MQTSAVGQNIRAFRLEKGVTQEAMASRLGVTCQAVSKWETGSTLPDIMLLPEIAVYFGVSIDELFSLSEAARLERIENMLDSARFLDAEQFQQAEAFLRAAVERGPHNHRANGLLAGLYLHQAATLRKRAEACAKAALREKPEEKAYHSALVESMNGLRGDIYFRRHDALIRYYAALLEKHPDNRTGCAFYLDQLLDDNRLDEAEAVLAQMRRLHPRHVENLFYAGDIAYLRGRHEEARALWAQGITDYDGKPGAGHFLHAGRMELLGENEAAISDYRASFEAAPKPRYVDDLIAMAQLYERMGDWARAIAMREEEIRVKAEEWHIETGEDVELPRREIMRLKARMA